MFGRIALPKSVIANQCMEVLHTRVIYMCLPTGFFYILGPGYNFHLTSTTLGWDTASSAGNFLFTIYLTRTQELKTFIIQTHASKHTQIMVNICYDMSQDYLI